MKTATLSATFDGEQIRLEEDYPLAKDARLLVTVLPDDFERERRTLSAGDGSPDTLAPAGSRAFDSY